MFFINVVVVDKRKCSNVFFIIMLIAKTKLISKCSNMYVVSNYADYAKKAKNLVVITEYLVVTNCNKVVLVSRIFKKGTK